MRPQRGGGGHRAGAPFDVAGAGICGPRRCASCGRRTWPRALVEATADQVVAQTLATHCVSLERPLPADGRGGTVEPAALRRADGTSQYTVAGSTLFTSSPVLAAEEYLVAAAGRTGGWAVTEAHVGVALAESAANGVTLNEGQAALVTAMATSGARVQAAIAPAGSGKTTAMRALTQAWTDGGGTVIGLAPSAAAAEQLRDQTSAPTDTLAKLCWHLDQGTTHPNLPRIDEGTLVLVDEAGMADTLSLLQVVRHVLDAGGSVRLIGDDQQLAAIGAGGVLRDIETTHGVLRLDELVRFRDPAEGAASLALRAGRPEALGFYLDQKRVHVGDLATMTTDVFTAWSTDRQRGLDSIMLAPTRELVAELNTRARHQRLNGAPAGREVWLSDGLPASAGDTILTRRNNRRLRTSATDFVKNGDRWQVVDARADGSLHVAHTRTGRRVTLPADYVAEHVELGYASTIHTAQGISVDTTHGVLSGGESRQLLYTMMTRGREANHAYLAVVSDGNEHTTFAPETVSPLTPTDMLEKILGRDDSPVSATTQTRIAADPATQLADATRRYADAIGVAAAQIADPDLLRHLTRRINAMVPGITDCDAWPTLVNRLLLIAADGRDPFAETQHALTSSPLGDARDEASVLVARLETRTRDRGPLPWLPGIPTRLADHPTWGPYLRARSTLVGALADHVRAATLTGASQPAWVRSSSWTPPISLVADVEVFRAATGVDAADLRPTGDPQFQSTIRRYQTGLDRRLREDHSPRWPNGDRCWPTCRRPSPPTRTCPNWPASSATCPATAPRCGPCWTPPACSRCPMTTPLPRCGGGSPASSTTPNAPANGAPRPVAARTHQRLGCTPRRCRPAVVGHARGRRGPRPATRLAPGRPHQPTPGGRHPDPHRGRHPARRQPRHPR